MKRDKSPIPLFPHPTHFSTSSSVSFPVNNVVLSLKYVPKHKLSPDCSALNTMAKHIVKVKKNTEGREKRHRTVLRDRIRDRMEVKVRGAHRGHHLGKEGVLLRLILRTGVPGQPLLVEGDDHLRAASVGLPGRDKVCLVRVFPEEPRDSGWCLLVATEPNNKVDLFS